MILSVCQVPEIVYKDRRFWILSYICLFSDKTWQFQRLLIKIRVLSDPFFPWWPNMSSIVESLGFVVLSFLSFSVSVMPQIFLLRRNQFCHMNGWNDESRMWCLFDPARPQGHIDRIPQSASGNNESITSGTVEVTAEAFCFLIPPVRGKDRVVEIPVRKNVAVPQALNRPHQQHGNSGYWLCYAVGHCANRNL